MRVLDLFVILCKYTFICFLYCWLYFTGYYLYIETSQHNPNDSARIISPPVTSGGAACILFWYHMYGADVNRLNMYIRASGSASLGKPYWTRSGTHGDRWVPAQVEVVQLSNSQVGVRFYTGLEVLNMKFALILQTHMVVMIHDFDKVQNIYLSCSLKHVNTSAGVDLSFLSNPMINLAQHECIIMEGQHPLH